MKKSISLNEKQLKSLIRLVLEDIGGYRNNFKDFESIVRDFANAYKEEGPDGTNVDKHYWEIVASYKDEGVRYIRQCGRNNNHLSDNLGKLSVDENVSEIYNSVFEDKNISLIKQKIAESFEKNGLTGVRKYINTLLFNQTIDFYRKSDMKDKFKNDKGEHIQLEVPAAFTRSAPDSQGNSSDAIQRSAISVDPGNSQFYELAGKLEYAIKASKEGTFKFSTLKSKLLARAICDVLMGNRETGISQAKNDIELDTNILNRFNELIGITRNVYQKRYEEGKMDDAKYNKAMEYLQPANRNYYYKLFYNFMQKDVPNLRAQFGTMDTDSENSMIAENILRKLIKNTVSETINAKRRAKARTDEAITHVLSKYIR